MLAARIGLDVGGTHVRAGVVRGRELTSEHRVARHLSRVLGGGAPDRAREEVLKALLEAIGVARRSASDAESVGIAFPGFLDPTTGLLRHSPNLPGLEDVDLAGPLEERIRLPVTVENDALCAAWGEHALHPDQPDSLLYVGLGTGVGGGAILGGAPWRGDHGVAMEVGHLIVEPGGRPCGCGNHGCLESYASAMGVRASYFEARGEVLESEEIAARARAGDGAARTAYSRAGGALGFALAHLAKVLDVSDVVVGGGLAGAWDLLEPACRRRLEKDVLPVQRGTLRVRRSLARDQAGMLGAALMGGA